eukprot:scaffold10026_cov62-Phaeocystis_antarctica.AAC.2
MPKMRWHCPRLSWSCSRASILVLRLMPGTARAIGRFRHRFAPRRGGRVDRNGCPSSCSGPLLPRGS